MGCSNLLTISSQRALLMIRPPLTAEQQAEARVLADRILEVARAEVLAIAELLVSKPDHQILGPTEFQVRDHVHQIGAKAIEAALEGRKKGATKAPA